MEHILAAVVTYNRKELLMECIDALYRQIYDRFEILIIDNASTDGTENVLRKHVEEGLVIYIRMNMNTGGAGGFNAAMRYAVENGYDYIWVMDDDAVPTESALAEMIRFIRTIHGKWGFVSGNVIWRDGSKCLLNRQKIIRGKLCREATFVSMMLPTAVIRVMGLPVRDFFLWSDDIEYSRRIARQYPCYYAEKSVTVHNTVNNVGSNIAFDSPNRLNRYRYAYRNEVYIAKEEGFIRMLYQTARVLHHILRVAFCSRSHKLKRIRIIIYSSIEGFFFRPVIEYVKSKDNSGDT